MSRSPLRMPLRSSTKIAWLRDRPQGLVSCRVELVGSGQFSLSKTVSDEFNGLRHVTKRLSRVISEAKAPSPAAGT